MPSHVGHHGQGSSNGIVDAAAATQSHQILLYQLPCRSSSCVWMGKDLVTQILDISRSRTLFLARSRLRGEVQAEQAIVLDRDDEETGARGLHVVKEAGHPA